MTLWKTRFAAALTIGLTVVACSLDDLVPEGSLGIDDGASGGAKESYKVDNDSEARIEIEETGATLTVPKGAVEHAVTIGVERPSDIKAIEFVESLKTVKAVASAPYVLTPHGTEFTKDLKLQIPVVANKGKELVAAYLKDESDREWKYLDTPVVEGDVATVTLKHFSVIVLLDRERAGFDVAPDAGSATPGSNDAGDELLDAGTSEVEDAGSAPDPTDAESAPEPTDAGTRDDQDTGATRADAGGSALDAGAAIDAGTGQVLDAADPTPAPEAGMGAAEDAGSASNPDADTPPPVDTGVQLPPDDAGDPNAQDAGFVPDTGTEPIDSGYDACEPYWYCAYDQCGSIVDTCGGEHSCGNCEQHGGECGFYEPGRCGFPTQL